MYGWLCRAMYGYVGLHVCKAMLSYIWLNKVHCHYDNHIWGTYQKVEGRFFWGYHPTLKLSGIPTFTLIVSLTYSMDNKKINLQYSIKFLAIGVNATWLYCHASLGSESKFCCCQISRLHIVRISALRWTEFHQNRKDPMREIQRFPNLGHNLCENDKQTLLDYI